jgi:hypothetical protein
LVSTQHELFAVHNSNQHTTVHSKPAERTAVWDSSCGCDVQLHISARPPAYSFHAYASAYNLVSDALLAQKQLRAIHKTHACTYTQAPSSKRTTAALHVDDYAQYRPSVLLEHKKTLLFINWNLPVIN